MAKPVIVDKTYTYTHPEYTSSNMVIVAIPSNKVTVSGMNITVLEPGAVSIRVLEIASGYTIESFSLLAMPNEESRDKRFGKNRKRGKIIDEIIGDLPDYTTTEAPTTEATTTEATTTEALYESFNAFSSADGVIRAEWFNYDTSRVVNGLSSTKINVFIGSANIDDYIDVDPVTKTGYKEYSNIVDGEHAVSFYASNANNEFGDQLASINVSIVSQTTTTEEATTTEEPGTTTPGAAPTEAPVVSFVGTTNLDQWWSNATFSWDPVDNATTYEYAVNGGAFLDETYGDTSITTGGNPGSQLTIVIRAKNDFGVGPESEPVTVGLAEAVTTTTLSPEDLGIPVASLTSNINIDEWTSKAEVSFTLVDNATGYEFDIDESGFWDDVDSIDPPGVTVYGMPESTVTVRIRAKNAVGAGNYGEPLVITMAAYNGTTTEVPTTEESTTEEPTTEAPTTNNEPQYTISGTQFHNSFVDNVAPLYIKTQGTGSLNLALMNLDFDNNAGYDISFGVSAVNDDISALSRAMDVPKCPCGDLSHREINPQEVSANNEISALVAPEISTFKIYNYTETVNVATTKRFDYDLNGTKVAIYVDDRDYVAGSGAVSGSQINQTAIDEIGNSIVSFMPSLTSKFGTDVPTTESAITDDYNYFVISREVNGNGAVGVLGYFWAGDFTTDPDSNQKKLLYIASDVYGQYGADAVSATCAHEFQHLLFCNNKMDQIGLGAYLDLNISSKDAWINEGFAMYALVVAGFGPEAANRDRNLLAHVQHSLEYCDVINMLLFFQPDHPTYGPLGDSYGMSFLFTDYLVTRFGDGIILEVISSPDYLIDPLQPADPMADSSYTNIDNIGGLRQALATRGTTFEQVFQDFVIALMVAGTIDEDATHKLTSINIRSTYTANSIDHVLRGPWMYSDANSMGEIVPTGMVYFKPTLNGDIDVNIVATNNNQVNVGIFHK